MEQEVVQGYEFYFELEKPKPICEVNDGWEDPNEIDFNFREFEEEKPRRGIRCSYLQVIAVKRGFNNTIELKRSWRHFFDCLKNIRKFFYNVDNLVYARYYFSKNSEWVNFRARLQGYRNKYDRQMKGFTRPINVGFEEWYGLKIGPCKSIISFFYAVDKLRFARYYFSTETQWDNFLAKLKGYKSKGHRFNYRKWSSQSEMQNYYAQKAGYKSYYFKRKAQAISQGYKGVHNMWIAQHPGKIDYKRAWKEKQIKKLGFNGVGALDDYMCFKRTGFKTRKLYRDAQAQKLGYKNYYQMYITKKRSKELRKGILTLGEKSTVQKDYSSPPMLC